MHSAYSRANAIFAFMLWVLTVVTLACFLSTVFLDYTTTAKLSINDIKMLVSKVFLTSLLYQELPHSFNYIFQINIE